MPGMFFHAYRLWMTACEARDRAITLVDAQPDRLVTPQDTAVAIIMSAASAEAFINELAEHAAICSQGPSGKYLPAHVAGFAAALAEIENEKGSLLLKYLVASQLLSGKMLDKGGQPFQDFKTLVNLRNALMHFRPLDMFDDPDAGDWPHAVPKFVKTLQMRKLAHTPPKKVGLSWFDALLTKEMATWACRSALQIICAILEMIPVKSPDDLGFGFSQFRKHCKSN